MNKIIQFFILSIIIISLNGCVEFNPPLKKGDSAIILSDNVKNPDGVSGNAFLYFKNLQTGEEEYVYISSEKEHTYYLKLTEGTYKFTHWKYNACRYTMPDGRTCKEMHNFVGHSEPLKKNGIFTIKKGETLYLGHFELDASTQTFTVNDHYLKNINEVKKRYPKIKKRSIENYSEKLNIKDWKFYIERHAIFGFL